MPPIVAAAYIHTKRKSGQSSTRACTCSLVATIVAMIVFYSVSWVSAFNSIGVDFGMVFAVMLSPFWMPLITVIAHKLGTENSTESIKFSLSPASSGLKLTRDVRQQE